LYNSRGSYQNNFLKLLQPQPEKQRKKTAMENVLISKDPIKPDSHGDLIVMEQGSIVCFYNICSCLGKYSFLDNGDCKGKPLCCFKEGAQGCGASVEGNHKVP